MTYISYDTDTNVERYTRLMSDIPKLSERDGKNHERSA